MEPVIVAVLVGIAVYVFEIALIPKSILSRMTPYTRAMLRRLEAENAGIKAVGGDLDSVLREHIQKSTLLTRVFFTLPGSKAVYPQMMKAGLTNYVDTFFIVCLVVLLLLVYLLKSMGLWSVLAAGIVTYLAALWYIRRRIYKRNEAFLLAFPDALDMIVRSVRSGYPLNAAVRMVAENMQPPVSTEFKQVADETAYGSPLIDALQRLSMRVDEPDIHFFVVVLTVQQEVGGNLAEVLSNLSTIIRKRKHLRLKVRALTSEGRATTWVLSALPVFVATAIYYTTPSHLTPFITSPLGNMMLALAIGIVLLGVGIVRKMVNFKA